MNKTEFFEEDLYQESIEHSIEEKDSIPSEVLTFNASYSLPEYADKFRRKVFLRPEFQRNSVWNIKGKSRFIESILFNYPIPQVFLYKTLDKEQYLIVDGFQRITAISEFLNNEFKLKGVNNKFDGLGFSDLSEDTQEKLRSHQLNACMIRQITPNDVQTLYYIFERLNTGGQNLNNMEVRRAVNYGPLIKMLEDINVSNENWRKILGTDVNKRFLDTELLLRILAFSEKWDPQAKIVSGYESMKSFLNEFCHKNQYYDKPEFKSKLAKVSEKVIRELGEKPFTVYTRYNYVLLDSVLSALIIIKKDVKCLDVKFEKLKQDPEFKQILEAKQGTISVKNVNKRIERAIEIFSHD